MSRRRRRKTNNLKQEKSQAGSRRKGLWWKLLLGFGVLVVGGAFFAYNRAIAFLHSDEFRTNVSAQVGGELGGVGKFGDFKWDGLSGKNDSFQLTGEGAIAKVDVKDVSLDVKLDYIKRDKFRLKNVRVGKVNAELDLRKEFVRVELAKKKKGFIESLLPDEVELQDVEVEEINATVHTDSGDYSVSGMHLETAKDNDSYKANIKGGVVTLPFSFLNRAELKQGEIVQDGEEIYVKKTQLKIFKSGTITLNGDIDLSPGAAHLYDMKGELSGLSCKDVFPNDWHRHLTGEVQGKFRIKPYQGTTPKTVGKLEIKNGVLQALPILSKVSLYLAEPKYRTLHFEKFNCDFEKFKDDIHLRNIVLVSSELIKIEGDLKIKGENLDGLFNVGVPAVYLDKIPGAKNGVFTRGKDQLLWTQVKIGGTFDNLTEDLSDRLIMAAGEEMIRRALSMGGEAINPETVKKIMESGRGALDKVLDGEKGIIDGGIDAAQGIFKDLTGGADREEDSEEKENEENDEEDEEDGGGSIIPDIPDIRKILPFL